MSTSDRKAELRFVAGKGGVGSSTVAAASAYAAARDGADVLFVAVDGRPGMGRLLGGREITDREHEARRFDGGGRIRARTIPADQAFADYLELRGVGGLLRRAAASASLPMIAAATPGLENLLVLGKLKELTLDNDADVIIVDAPPAGHAAPFLRSATALSDVVRSGPVLDQAEQVRELLTDASRCSAILVSLPEETPITEMLELGDDLSADVGLAISAHVVNACWTDRAGLAKSPAMAARSHGFKLSAGAKAALESSAAFGRVRLERQREQLARVEQSTGHAPITLPRLPRPQLEPTDLAILAEVLVPT